MHERCGKKGACLLGAIHDDDVAVRIEGWHHRGPYSHGYRNTVLLNDVERRKQHCYAADLLPETTGHIKLRYTDDTDNQHFFSTG